LCTRALVLERGRVTFDGDVPSAVRAYQDSFTQLREEDPRTTTRPGSGEARITAVRPVKPMFSPDEVKIFEIEIDTLTASAESFAVSATVVDELGIGILECDMRFGGCEIPGDQIGTSTFVLRVRSPWLHPGRYRIDAKIHRLGPWVDVFDGAAEFEVLDLLPYAFTGPIGAAGSGVTLPDFDIERV
jgi:lipopolysaccharide transport system ATP-binding protein